MSNNCVSVIVPVYCVEKYLDESLSSLTNQTYKNLEIILVDDCSPDRSGSICDKWASTDSRINVIHKSRNEGVSAARNTALNHISGEYVFFMDPDDVLSPCIIEILQKNITKYDADVAVCHEIAFVAPKESPMFSINSSNTITIETTSEYIEHFTDPFTGPVGWLWNKLYRKQAIGNIRFRNFRVVEDIVFNAEVSINIHKAVWTDSRLYGYRIREDSAMAAQKKDLTLDSAKAWLYSYEVFKTYYPSFSEKYMTYLLGKFANLGALSLSLYGKESAIKMKSFYDNVYDNNISNLSTISVKDRVKLFLARYAFFIYYLTSSGKHT